MKTAAQFLIPAGAAALALLAIGGCAKLAVEGGDKPIHLVVDINIKIDRQLDQFFAFEDQYKGATTQPSATQPSTSPTALNADKR